MRVLALGGILLSLLAIYKILVYSLRLIDAREDFLELERLQEERFR